MIKLKNVNTFSQNREGTNKVILEAQCWITYKKLKLEIILHREKSWETKKTYWNGKIVMKSNYSLYSWNLKVNHLFESNIQIVILKNKNYQKQ